MTRPPTFCFTLGEEQVLPERVEGVRAVKGYVKPRVVALIARSVRDEVVRLHVVEARKRLCAASPDEMDGCDHQTTQHLMVE